METISLRKELAKLNTMPYFLVRFIALSVFLAADDCIRLLFKVGEEIPVLSVAIVAVILFSALGVFAVFEIKTLKQIKPTTAYFKQPYFIFWFAFSLIALISGIVNLSPLYSIGIFVLMPIFILMVQEKRFCTMFLASCIFTLVCDIVISIICYPIFSNNISLSFVAIVPVVLCAIAWVLLNTGKSHTYLVAFLVFVLIVILYFTNVSGGRTAFLSTIFTIICFIIALSVKFSLAKKHKHYHYSTIVFTTIVVLIVFVTLVSSAIILIDSHSTVPDEVASIEGTNIHEKFVIALENGNPFSSRGMIWKYTIANANLLGHSPDFYLASDFLSPGQNQAHNMYLAVLGHYGILAFVAFIIFCVQMLICSIRYALSERRLYIFPFIVLVAYFSTAIAEDILIMWGPRLFTLLFYCACAYLIVSEGRRAKRERAKKIIAQR